MTVFKVWQFEGTDTICQLERDAELVEANTAEDAAITYAKKHSREEGREMTDVAVRDGLTEPLRTYDVYRPDLVAGETSFILDQD